MDLSRRAFLGASTASIAGVGAGVAGCLDRARFRSDGRECPATVGGSVDARLGFAGDVMLGRGVNEHWTGGPPAGVWGSTHDRLRSLDGLFVNLECCVSDRGERRPGRTYHFRADPGWAVPALSAGNVAFASLANNHVLDYGSVALADTTAHLAGGGIPHAGAGSDVREAVRPAVTTAGELTVAVLAFTDQAPTYGATASAPGSAFARLVVEDRRTRRLVDAGLREAREADPDLVVASLHWGPNWETRPSRPQQEFARWLVDRGVDVVHGHSAHVIQGVEVYRGRPIVYDGGDFVDDYTVKPGLHNDRSFLFELEIEGGRVDALRLVPVEIRDETVERARPGAAEWLRARMRSLSGAFGTTLDRAGAGLRVPLAEC